MKKLSIIIGARPQFIKHAPLEFALRDDFILNVIHTGQHYDDDMSSVFFDELDIDKPSDMLGVGSHSHAKQTSLMLVGIEEVLLREKPDGIIIYGDTNSTLAGALVAQKMHIPVFHVEAGLRSWNMKMPEEVNRVLTDHISDLLFVPTDKAVSNLHQEGIRNGIHMVGDIMYDILKLSIDKNILKQQENDNHYYYATIHRPYNTDDSARLRQIFEALNSMDLKVSIALHPRTLSKMRSFNIMADEFRRVEILKPQSYFDNLNLLFNSKGLITDSGGMQKEAYWLKKKCITVRPETEWSETLVGNWNELISSNLGEICSKIVNPPGCHYPNIYGDGNTSRLISQVIKQYLS